MTITKDDLEVVRHPDPTDTASDNALRETQFRLEQARCRKPDQKSIPVLNVDGSPVLENGKPKVRWEITECVDCYDEIPQARLEATGTIRCVVCQSRREQRR